MAEDELLNTTDAARILNVSADWLRGLANRGTVPSMRSSNGYRLFKRSDIERIARERIIKPPKRGRPRTPPGERSVEKVIKQAQAKKKKKTTNKGKGKKTK